MLKISIFKYSTNKKLKYAQMIGFLAGCVLLIVAFIMIFDSLSNPHYPLHGPYYLGMVEDLCIVFWIIFFCWTPIFSKNPQKWFFCDGIALVILSIALLVNALPMLLYEPSEMHTIDQYFFIFPLFFSIPIIHLSNLETQKLQ